MDIPAPKADISQAERIIDCGFALRPAFQTLVDCALAAGWSGAEVAAALLGMSLDLGKMLGENAAPDWAKAQALGEDGG